MITENGPGRSEFSLPRAFQWQSRNCRSLSGLLANQFFVCVSLIRNPAVLYAAKQFANFHVSRRILQPSMLSLDVSRKFYPMLRNCMRNCIKVFSGSTAGLPIRQILGLHWYCCRGPISNPRPVSDSRAQTTRGKVLDFFQNLKTCSSDQSPQKDVYHDVFGTKSAL